MLVSCLCSVLSVPESEHTIWTRASKYIGRSQHSESSRVRRRDQVHTFSVPSTSDSSLYHTWIYDTFLNTNLLWLRQLYRALNSTTRNQCFPFSCVFDYDCEPWPRSITKRVVRLTHKHRFWMGLQGDTNRHDVARKRTDRSAEILLRTTNDKI